MMDHVFNAIMFADILTPSGAGMMCSVPGYTCFLTCYVAI